MSDEWTMNGPTMERAHVQDSPIDEIEAFIPMAYKRLALIGADLDDEEAKKEKAKEKERKLFQTENYSAEKLEFLGKLQERDPAQFRVAMVRIVAAELWAAQVKADAIAWARERETEQREQVFTELGYTNYENRGRKRQKRDVNPESFKVPLKFEDFSVQNTARIEALAGQFSVQDGKLIVHSEPKNSVQTPHPYRPEFESSESQLASHGEVNAKAKTSEAELKREAARTEIKNEISARLRKLKIMSLGAVAIDAATLNTLANELVRLQTAGEVRDVLDIFEERAVEIKTGRRVVDKAWGYLVQAIRGEVEKRLPTDLKTQIKSAAAGKTMTKAQKAGGR